MLTNNVYFCSPNFALERLSLCIMVVHQILVLVVEVRFLQGQPLKKASIIKTDTCFFLYGKSHHHRTTDFNTPQLLRDNWYSIVFVFISST